MLNGEQWQIWWTPSQRNSFKNIYTQSTKHVSHLVPSPMFIAKTFNVMNRPLISNFGGNLAAYKSFLLQIDKWRSFFAVTANGLWPSLLPHFVVVHCKCFRRVFSPKKGMEQIYHVLYFCWGLLCFCCTSISKSAKKILTFGFDPPPPTHPFCSNCKITALFVGGSLS